MLRVWSRRAPRLRVVASALILGIVLGCSAASARAGSIVQIGGGAASSLEGLGSFPGSLAYSAASALSTTGTLVVTLTNTSSAANGGFITGFLFNIGSDEAPASASIATASHPFVNCTGNGLNGAPYGTYEAGAAIGGNFLGGGNPNPGIGVGHTGIFTFNIAASNARSLTALDFLNGGAFDFDFLVRFKGFEDGGSDKVGAIVVPLPPAFFMGVLGLGCALLASRLKRKEPSEDAG